MISGIQTSANGAIQAAQRVQESAARIAAAGARDSRIDNNNNNAPAAEDTLEVNAARAQGLDNTSRELINQKIATYDFKANLRALEVQQENEEHLLNILS